MIIFVIIFFPIELGPRSLSSTWEVLAVHRRAIASVKITLEQEGVKVLDLCPSGKCDCANVILK